MHRTLPSLADRAPLPSRLVVAAVLLSSSAMLVASCSESRPSEDDVTPGGGNGDNVGDNGTDDCALPCLFGTVCQDRRCVIPCDPVCSDEEECLLGFCVGGPDDENEDGGENDDEEFEPCAPSCAPDEVCESGLCMVADACEPPCEGGRFCNRTGACVDAGACETDRDCDNPNRCVGGGCVAPIDPDAYEPAATASYVWRVELPDPRGVDDCCFDMNGDGENDNAIAVFGAFLDGFGIADFQGDWASSIAEGTLGYVFEFRGVEQGDGPVDLGVVRVTNDVDGDGRPDQRFSRRVAGEGEFAIDRDSLTAYGPETRFPRASVERGALWSGVSDFVMAFPPGALLATGDGPAFYRIRDARIAGALDIDGTSVSSRELDIGDDDPVSSIRLGGAITAEDWVDELNLGALECGCLRLDAGEPLFDAQFDGDALVISCNETADLPRCLNRDDECAALPLLCQALPLASRFGPWDVDLDGDGRFEAASIGMRLSLSPATLVR